MSDGPGAAVPGAITGWLLDLYADPEGELALWIIQDTLGAGII